MARIVGVNIPDNKHVTIALRSIYGVGSYVATQLCTKARVNPQTQVSKLSGTEMDNLRNEITKLSVEGDLRRANTLNIKRLMDLGCMRGIRHRRNLPVRGQRTRTNARTRKGPKRAIK